MSKIAMVLVTVPAVAALTAVPAHLGGRRPVAAADIAPTIRHPS
ncbi:hypothetical protein [Nonomuraea jabiensis]